MLELRRDARPLAVGHRGAAALAPENTLESLHAALDLGVDAIEFDVRAQPDGTLVLAHDPAVSSGALTLDEALSWFGGHGAIAHVDVKAPGYEDGVVAALRRHDLLGRAYVSSARAASIRRFAELAPELPRALAYPEDRLGLSGPRVMAPFVAGALVGMRHVLPLRIAPMLRSAGATAAALHHQLLTPATVRRCHALGIPVIAWTVNDAARLRALTALGVDAVVSDDPRIFASTLSA